ncbi:hypothetical protein BLNAU_12456 [Blattamonas nauphoetae]|uniref:Right handed beta helix domain-containing protein n=1 Tax=Blattamonas nauphoetae TaxID=2049346 RepID=A0ABQ9XJL9_9EUKA|nr:hypothetical protein BLNAU_12456 [Blattamonas nauphoetae]
MKPPYDWSSTSFEEHPLIFWERFYSPNPPNCPFSYATFSTPIIFTDCQFSHFSESAIVLLTPAPLTVFGCSFSDCNSSAYQGGGIASCKSAQSFTTTIHVELSLFEDCPSSWRGGGLGLIVPGRNTVTSSNFTRCVAVVQSGGGGFSKQHFRIVALWRTARRVEPGYNVALGHRDWMIERPDSSLNPIDTCIYLSLPSEMLAQQHSPKEEPSRYVDWGQATLVTIENLGLVPIQGFPLVSCMASNAKITIRQIRMSSVIGISPVPFVFTAGQVSMELCHFTHLTQMTTSLISVTGTCSLEIKHSAFEHTTSRSPIIFSEDAKLQILQCIFRNLTRSEGSGASAIDSFNSEDIQIFALFTSCSSLTGIAGALQVTITKSITFHSSPLVFCNNTAFGTNAANDLHLSGASLPASHYVDIYSSSAAPSIVDKDGEHVPFTIDFIHVFDEDNLSDHPLCLPPLVLDDLFFELVGFMGRSLPLIAQTHSASGPLFSIVSNGQLYLSDLTFLISSDRTHPTIVVDETSTLRLLSGVLISQGQRLTQPFLLSTGSVLLTSPQFSNLRFSGCSCVLIEGGTFTIDQDAETLRAHLNNVTTDGDGAFLHASSATVNIAPFVFGNCHARNGGALCFQDCYSVSVSSCIFTHCSASKDGGSIIVENHNTPDAYLAIEWCCFADCSAERGGGFFINTSASSSLSLDGGGDANGEKIRTTLQRGLTSNIEETVFLVVAYDGTLELNSLTLEWPGDLVLVQLVDPSATLTIAKCHLIYGHDVTDSIIICQSGSLVMSSTEVECTNSNCEVDVPFISIEGGKTVLDQTSLTTAQTMTTASSSLIVQSSGSFTMKNMVVTDITLQTGDGSAISAALTTNTDQLSIESTTFASCSSSAGNGGALAVTITSGSLSLNTCRFEKCSSAMNGGAIWLDLSQMPSPSQYSLLKTTFGTDGSANKASGMGHCVFVLGEDLRRVIVRRRWEGSFEEAEADDLWGKDNTTPPSGISLLSLLQSHVMGVGEGGRDDATGTTDAPFKTLRWCFMATEPGDGPFDVVVVERARIGESYSLEDQSGWTMDVSGSGSGGSCEVLSSVSDEERKPGTASSPMPRAMVTLSGQTLSFFDILFSSLSAPRSMQFVFSLLTSSHLTLSSCSLSSSSPIAVSFVSASAVSSFSVDTFSMNSVSFVRKAALVMFGDSSEITLTSSSFLTISLEGGALLWGTTSGAMKVTNTSFSHCNGEVFGSVIRTKIVGITTTITNCTFSSCSTRVKLGEKGERSVVGGGCVVVEMMKRTISTRRLPSSSVDLSLSSFSDCMLTKTDTSSSQSSLSEFVGGSGFLIVGNENSDSAILQKVTLSRCLCTGFGKMSVFDGGVVVGRRHALFTDRRGSSVRECGMGSVQIR